MNTKELIDFLDFEIHRRKVLSSIVKETRLEEDHLEDVRKLKALKDIVLKYGVEEIAC